MRRLYICLHEWLIFMVHVGKYTIHGSYGNFIVGCLQAGDILKHLFQFLAVFWVVGYLHAILYSHCLELKAPKVFDSSHTSACYMGGGCPSFIYIWRVSKPEDHKRDLPTLNLTARYREMTPRSKKIILPRPIIFGIHSSTLRGCKTAMLLISGLIFWMISSCLRLKDVQNIAKCPSKSFYVSLRNWIHLFGTYIWDTVMLVFQVMLDLAWSFYHQIITMWGTCLLRHPPSSSGKWRFIGIPYETCI